MLFAWGRTTLKLLFRWRSQMGIEPTHGSASWGRHAWTSRSTRPENLPETDSASLVVRFSSPHTLIAQERDSVPAKAVPVIESPYSVCEYNWGVESPLCYMLRT